MMAQFRNRRVVDFKVAVLLACIISTVGCGSGSGGSSGGNPPPAATVEWATETVPGYTFNWVLYGISMIDTSTGWAVGYGDSGTLGASQGVIVKRSGAAWIDDTPTALLGDGTVLRDVDFPASNEGWAVGFNNGAGYVLHYSGGAWAADSLPVIAGSWELLADDFTSVSEGWAVGRNYTDGQAVILHYLSGIWSQVASPAVSANWQLFDVSFPIPSEGWAVGRDESNPGASQGVILHFQSGSWSQIIEPAVSGNWLLEAVDMISTTEGWAIGHDIDGTSPVVLHYLSGTWSRETNVPTCITYGSDVDFVDATEGWIVGTGYNALRYQSGAWSCSVLAQNVNTPVMNAVSVPAVDSAWTAGTGAIYTFTGP